VTEVTILRRTRNALLVRYGLRSMIWPKDEEGNYAPMIYWAEPWENLPPSKQEAHDSHPSRKLYATTVWIDRDLLDAWDDQIAELRSQQFLRAMTALERENIARKAQGLRPLRKLLPRHFNNGEKVA